MPRNQWACKGAPPTVLKRVKPVVKFENVLTLYFTFDISDPTKYFGCELGAQTQFDFKNDRYIVNGSHDAAKLQDMLDGFIKKFVLCENCDNPETDLKCYIKKGIITASCR